MKIASIRSWWVLDSRGNPTVTVQVSDSHNHIARSFVPSGASTGSHEALELRDGGVEFSGKGVQTAVNNINTTIAAALTNVETLHDAETILLSLDTTPNKKILGANAVLGVSMALHRLRATEHRRTLAEELHAEYFANIPLSFPRLMSNIINGGAHSDAGLAIQEFMVVPHTNDLVSDVRAASEIYHTLKKLLAADNQVTSVGDEGGFAPHLTTTREALDAVMNAIQQAGYAGQCDIALDCAATEFFNKDHQTYTIDNTAMSQSELVYFYEQLVSEYPIISIEDGCSEDDLEGWAILTNALASKILLVGDDLFVTNVDRVQTIGIDQKIANSLLVKLNQIGSVSESAQAIHLARNNGMTTIISHRSGETEDSFIADLSVASGSRFIKLGAPARTDRTVKYNRLLELYHTLTIPKN